MPTLNFKTRSLVRPNYPRTACHQIAELFKGLGYSIQIETEGGGPVIKASLLLDFSQNRCKTISNIIGDQVEVLCLPAQEQGLGWLHPYRFVEEVSYWLECSTYCGRLIYGEAEKRVFGGLAEGIFMQQTEGSIGIIMRFTKENPGSFCFSLLMDRVRLFDLAVFVHQKTVKALELMQHHQMAGASRHLHDVLYIASKHVEGW